MIGRTYDTLASGNPSQFATGTDFASQRRQNLNACYTSRRMCGHGSRAARPSPLAVDSSSYRLLTRLASGSEWSCVPEQTALKMHHFYAC